MYSKSFNLHMDLPLSSQNANFFGECVKFQCIPLGLIGVQRIGALLLKILDLKFRLVIVHTGSWYQWVCGGME